MKLKDMQDIKRGAGLLKKLVLAVSSLGLSIVLAGCAPFAFQNINDLLHAPALGQGQGEIQEALAKTLNGQPQYKFPKEGSWRSPLITADLNGDGVEEAVLLYSINNGVAQPEKANNVYIAVLENVNNTWKVTQKMEGVSTEVASMEVVDLLSDGTKQLIVGFGSNLGTKTFSLYQYQDKALKEMYSTPYITYGLGDFTGRGGTDLVLITAAEKELVFSYMPVVNGQLEPPQTPIKLNSNFVSCSGIYPTVGPDGNRYLIVDGVPGNDALSSQVIAFSGERFYIPEELSRVFGESTRLNPLLKSRDIDKDGVVEIPVQIEGGKVSTPKEDKRLEFVEWKDFTEPEPKTKQYGLLDSDRNVYLRLPDEWRGYINVLDGPGTGEWILQNSKTLAQMAALKVLEPGQTAPVDAMHLPGTQSSYLVLANNLTAAELESIQLVLLS